MAHADAQFAATQVALHDFFLVAGDIMTSMYPPVRDYSA